MRKIRIHGPWPAILLVTLALVATPVFPQDEDCLACHDIAEDPSAEEEGYGVDGAAWFASIHADVGVTCDTCHEGKDDYPHEPIPPIACADCHDDAAEDMARSVHGLEMARDGADSPWPEGEPCGACHGIHDIRAVDDPLSRAYFRNVVETCVGCHGDYTVVQPFGLTTDPVDKYALSVHGLSLDDPELEGAVCTNCHGAHLVLPASDPESGINPFRLAHTCGECHSQESEDYLASVHGVAFENGVSAAPSCTDCHGIHSIKMVPDEDASPLEARLVRTTCVTCHSSEALMSEYGVTPARVESYEATYHGLARQRGNKVVADCASCHGIHGIFPSSDPRSSVAPENLEATCGTCHPGAGREFARNPVHFAVGGQETLDVVISRWVRRIYWALLIGVLGGMLVHNGIIVSYWLRRRWRHERGAERVRRFTRGQVIQHAVLFVTFSALAITGFVIAYPDFWWSRLLEAAGLTEAVRRTIHRAAAIGMLAAGAYHVVWLLGTRYGRDELRRIWPRWRDLKDVVQNLRFHLGKTDRPPAPDKYDYPAKLEYWAVVWGTVVMGITGIVLWFPVWATSFLPFWTVKVSEVIHLFEAWLATLAILFFHFFFVIGHPEIYPLSFAMLDGSMTREEAARRHPAWLASKLEQRAEPEPTADET